MPDYPGTFIVLEGSDGSGKKTQFKLLSERLKAVGYDVEAFDFPRYEEPSSHFVRRYLNGDYGPAAEISPYSASLFYALDRYEAAPLIRAEIQAGKVVLSNRYVGSNMAHQGAKFTSQAEQRGFFIWEDGLEYQLLNIPRPSINIFLRLPAELSRNLMIERSKKTGKPLDEHEGNLNHLKATVATYDTLCALFPKDFQAIDCAPNHQLMSITAINDLIWQKIQPLLPAKPQRAARGGVVKFDESSKPAILSLESSSQITGTGSNKKTRLSLLALLELSRGGAIQLEGLEMNVKQPDCFKPDLSEEQLQAYQDFLKRLTVLRQKIEKELSKKRIKNSEEILGLLLPVSTYCYLPKSGSTSALAEPDLSAGNALKRQLEKLAQTDAADTNISTDIESVTLLEARPHNEFSLLSDSLYGVSDLPRRQVQTGIDNWSYEQKYQALNVLLGDLELTIASQVSYRWDIIAEQGLLLELLLSGAVENLQLQAPTPRFGYSVPPEIEAAGLEDEYLECFDLSLELFSKLQSAKNPALAAYATLTGHRIRFQFSSNLEMLTKLPKVRSRLFENLLEQLLEQVREKQPITADFLTRHLAKNSEKPINRRHGRRQRRPK